MAGAMTIAEPTLGAAQVSVVLDLPDDLPFDEWLSIGRRLCLGSHAINWQIGDWWRHGVRLFGEDETRKAASEIWGVEGETARVYGWVAEKFDPVTRVTDLPFSHYRAVAALPAQDAVALVRKAAENNLSVRALRAEVAAIRGDNVVPIRQTQPRLPLPQPEPAPVPKNELTEAYVRYVEAMECLEEFRSLTKRELDFLTVAKDALGEAYAERRPCPGEFDVVFREQGRLACESHFGASRITINRWLMQRGKKRLLDERAAFVRMQRNTAKSQMPLHADDVQPEIDLLLPVARQAAQHLRISRWGGHKVSQCDTGGWYVGTVRKSSEELIVMAERVGFDRAAAAAEADREGY